MVAVVQSAALVGVEGHIIRVEVGLAGGVPNFTVVGLPDASVREARERVRAAIVASGFDWPKRRITINLAPAGLPKSGSWFDLPMALGILAADSQVPVERFEGRVVVGELALSGETRAVGGVLSAALRARQSGRGVIVPRANASEAASVAGLDVVPLARLADAVGDLPGFSGGPTQARVDVGRDLGDVVGQETAKLGLQIAAAGGHHCLLVGEPGSGKTMLARRVASILPPLTEAEQIEASLVHSVVGTGSGLLTIPPVRSPHHSASVTALVGGGTHRVVPGEASLAHCGVLHLDELGEFRPAALNALRQPLEDGCVQIVRTRMRVSLPARFLLVATTNLCPCGYLGSPQRPCACGPTALAAYRRRLNGPLIDRFGITVPVSPVSAERVLQEAGGHEESDHLRDRVVGARERQFARLGPGRLNASMTSAEVHQHVRLEPGVVRLLVRYGSRASTRALVGVQKVARTLADLDGLEQVAEEHIRVAWRLRVPAQDAHGNAVEVYP